MPTAEYDASSDLPPIVLLVDRHPDELQRYVRSLEGAGLWVATSADPSEALAAVENLDPDIIVADADVADPSGAADLVDVLRQHRSLGRVPFILMTSTPETPTLADSVLVKPVKPSDLVERTNHLLARSQQVRAESRDILERGTRLLEVSSTLLGKTARTQQSSSEHERQCPACGGTLEWVMQDTIRSVRYDYYRWCFSGCGLYCFDCDRSAWMKLA